MRYVHTSRPRARAAYGPNEWKCLGVLYYRGNRQRNRRPSCCSPSLGQSMIENATSRLTKTIVRDGGIARRRSNRASFFLSLFAK